MKSAKQKLQGEESKRKKIKIERKELPGNIKKLFFDKFSNEHIRLTESQEQFEYFEQTLFELWKSARTVQKCAIFLQCCFGVEEIYIPSNFEQLEFGSTILKMNSLNISLLTLIGKNTTK
eukprot:TRINITY_DN14198_c0_g1_i1.p3 TRINITY_DN14198_c0_g1~~TRINITY_DN14198_c0_g1_i1.p3  ORF type:complete len:120 (+),score=27.35 TRINITY_DN14198_c0_g1_i1:47-406(+)